MSAKREVFPDSDGRLSVLRTLADKDVRAPSIKPASLAAVFAVA